MIYAAIVMNDEIVAAEATIGMVRHRVLQEMFPSRDAALVWCRERLAIDSRLTARLYKLETTVVGKMVLEEKGGEHA